ncbi:MAG TPA: noncanonical pyrimidine nucleotidase, YjjG family [Marinilabiliales bacterium]|nr:noncanonical pyrimidine nucleotidase, YjjG family [Marinilabiliales bacterium]HBX85876.1 noncanonical pyrimidine nucleotidase, YjjG family [Marinilabiliales bacterium]
MVDFMESGSWIKLSSNPRQRNNKVSVLINFVLKMPKESEITPLPVRMLIMCTKGVCSIVSVALIIPASLISRESVCDFPENEVDKITMSTKNKFFTPVKFLKKTRYLQPANCFNLILTFCKKEDYKMQIKHQKTYRNLFFDLDRTLWDFKTNSEVTLNELIARHIPELSQRFQEFLDLFYRINDNLWNQYENGILKKEVLRTKRFEDTFAQMGIHANGLSQKMSDDYITESPLKTALFPHTHETLSYLNEKGYRLFLITNGFTEVQVVKIKHSSLEPYFEKMITSEEAGYQKPHRKIFEYALKNTHSRKKESIMIGDDLENDIFGARRFGIDTVFFNPEKIKYQQQTTFEIQSLADLRTIF